MLLTYYVTVLVLLATINETKLMRLIIAKIDLMLLTYLVSTTIRVSIATLNANHSLALHV